VLFFGLAELFKQIFMNMTVKVILIQVVSSSFVWTIEPLCTVSVKPLKHRSVLFAVFCQAGPSRWVDCLASRIQQLATASGVKPRFRNLSNTLSNTYTWIFDYPIMLEHQIKIFA